MKKLCFLLPALALTLAARTQRVEETFPKTLWCPNDSFFIRYKGYPELDAYSVSKNKVSPGTDAAPGEYAVLYYGADSLRINYHGRIPYGHVIYYNLESPKGKTRLRWHFNPVGNRFPDAYMARHRGDVQFDVPEVYELANIIWSLSPTGRRASDLNTQGAYYERMVKWFKPYLNHPVFRALDFPDSIAIQQYFDFRENSFAFSFADDKGSRLAYAGPYYYVFGDEFADSSLFGKLRPLVEDFAARSGFRRFYRDNRKTYAAQVERVKALLPVRRMWSWLEEQFPKSRYQSYRIVFSPLILGSHSTQNYTQFSDSGAFRESVMFICNADRYDRRRELTDAQREGLLSGVVFTEIDHNYVNPATNKFAKRIDSIFSKRATWAARGRGADYYSSPVSVFNEYMTHAAFCVYVRDVYDVPTANLVVSEREALMEERRQFIRFRAFNAELQRLRQAHKDKKLAELYPLILDWCERQE